MLKLFSGAHRLSLRQIISSLNLQIAESQLLVIYLKNILFHSIIIFLTGLLVFSNNKAGLFVGFDGVFIRSLIKNQFDWAVFTPSLINNPPSGIGNIPMPWNTHFSPAYVLSAHLNNGYCFAPLCYAIVSVEFFFCLVLMCRWLGISKNIAILSGWLATVTLTPFFWPVSFYPYTGMVPHLMEMLGLMCLCIGAFYRIGKDSVWESIGWSGLTILTASWLAIISSIFVVMFVPAMCFYSFLFLFMVQSRRELIVKVIFVLISSILVLISGYVPWVLGCYLETSSSFFLSEWAPRQTSLYTVSVLYHATVNWLGGREVFIGGLIGAVVLLFSNQRNFRKLALGSILAFTGLAWGGAFLLKFYDNRAPFFSIFETGLWPFYFVFFGIFATVVLEIASRCSIFFIKDEKARHYFHKFFYPVVILSIPLVALILSFKSSTAQSYPYPIGKTSIINRLEREIALSKEIPFRGYAANFTAFHNKPNGISWLDQHAQDHEIITKTGNDHRGPGLWYYNIPTLLEYNQLMTPSYYFMVSRLLTRNQDHTLRNIVVLSQIHLPYLRSIGVRFLITDFVMPDADQALERVSISDKLDLYLYEIKNANLGNYSPTEIKVAKDAAGILQIIQSPNFDFQKQIVLEDNIEGSFLPAQTSLLRFDKDGLHVKAASKGKSILLLPLQYSRCLQVIGSSSEKVKLIRANMLLTGLVFENEADVIIRFRFGPFENPWGRLQDYSDMKRLKLQDTAR